VRKYVYQSHRVEQGFLSGIVGNRVIMYYCHSLFFYINDDVTFHGILLTLVFQLSNNISVSQEVKK